MNVLKLREGFYWTGIQDASLKVFDIIMTTEFGTTYNSYLLQTGGKTVLFETAKEKFWDDYLEKLQELTDVSEIDYLVVSHTEPDHSGSIEHLLDLCPKLQIISTPTANKFIREIVNRDFNGITIKDEERMQIGEKTLRFMVVPNLHWPDTMYTYIEEDKILVTCDSFGSHYAFSDVLFSKVTDREGYWKAAKYYYDNILGPFSSFMAKALARVRKLEIELICTGHGPVLDTGFDELYAAYEIWSGAPTPGKCKTVVIPYVSAYGYTKMLAEGIRDGLLASGKLEVKLYDMVTADTGEVKAQLALADGILLGTPTILSEALPPIWDLVSSMTPVTHGGKVAGAFGSYGWSGEAVPHITQRLTQLRMKVMDGFKVRFKPNEADLHAAYDFGVKCSELLEERKTDEKTSI
jgi:flavorubredoxin